MDVLSVIYVISVKSNLAKVRHHVLYILWAGVWIAEYSDKAVGWMIQGLIPTGDNEFVFSKCPYCFWPHQTCCSVDTGVCFPHGQSARA